ncbi:hypothetical protein FHP25_33715 [Vineibacter terrae]|uniref:Helix-turn-helix domain-containing protein n=1 Tax=Vineibacter terrae TaxID=2586908 RepID=A0A5C8PA13_9HYPH|nr:hypothetical protein [Vineibacter terrae]TXL70612.1 hypothetical protein FHP25_33715 [Vineibacter terrae]
MTSKPKPTALPVALRLLEVQNAILDVFDERRSRPGSALHMAEIQLAMDRRGYGGRLVTRAIEGLCRAGRLRRLGPNDLELCAAPPTAAAARKTRRTGRRSRLKRRTALEV